MFSLAKAYELECDLQGNFDRIIEDGSVAQLPEVTKFLRSWQDANQVGQRQRNF